MKKEPQYLLEELQKTQENLQVALETGITLINRVAALEEHVERLQGRFDSIDAQFMPKPSPVYVGKIESIPCDVFHGMGEMNAMIEAEHKVRDVITKREDLYNRLLEAFGSDAKSDVLLTDIITEMLPL